MHSTKKTRAVFQPLSSQLTRNLRGLLLASSITAGLLAQDRNPDPFARRDAAKVLASQSTDGPAHLARAMSLRTELGLTTADTLEVINSVSDDLGGVHVRMQQSYNGVLIENGQLISHIGARGEYGKFTNALKTRIDVSTRPGLTEADALDSLARLAPPATAYATAPKVRLVILPVMERYLIATGAVVESIRTATDPGGKITDTRDGFDTPAGAVNSADTARRVKEYRLAYQVRTAEGAEGAGGRMVTTMFHIDANSGEMIRRQALESSANFTGQGNGKFSGQVTFNTVNYGAGFQMYDSHRNYFTMDNDRLPWDGVNTDSDTLLSKTASTKLSNWTGK